ncbi:hypothetical protein H9P43_006020 [Blastocladiella emersonii ATCC 22665]|nr:hypothetical protein H9P43_006020 [Blastocladiella emersonii ATCC 22665]
MRVGRLPTAAWNDACATLFDAKSPLRVSDLTGREVVVAPDRLRSLLAPNRGDADDDDEDEDNGGLDAFLRYGRTDYDATARELVLARGRNVLSAGAHPRAVDRFMALVDDADPVAAPRPVTAPSSPVAREIDPLAPLSLPPPRPATAAGPPPPPPPPPVSAAAAAPPRFAAATHGIARQSMAPFALSPLPSPTDATPAESARPAPAAKPLRTRVASETALNAAAAPASSSAPPAVTDSANPAAPPLRPAAAAALSGSEVALNPAPAPADPAPSSSLPAACPSTIATEANDDDRDTDAAFDRLPPPTMLVELAALATGDSQASLATCASLASVTDWADATVSDQAASALAASPTPLLPHADSSVSTTVPDDADADEEDLLFALIADAPTLTVPQIHAVLRTGFDAQHHTRFVDHVTDPATAELAARVLRGIVPRVPLRHLAQVVNWMVARPAEVARGTEPALSEVAAAAGSEGSAERGLRHPLGPGWPAVALAKLLLVATFDLTPDVAGLVVGFIAQSWPPATTAKVLSHMVQDEPASLAAQFIKSATWPWPLLQLAELVSLLDCSLKWRQSYFTRFMDAYYAAVIRDFRYTRPPVGVAGSEPAAVILARDQGTRAAFLATLLRTNLAVTQLRVSLLTAAAAAGRQRRRGTHEDEAEAADGQGS